MDGPAATLGTIAIREEARYPEVSGIYYLWDPKKNFYKAACLEVGLHITENSGLDNFGACSGLDMSARRFDIKTNIIKHFTHDQTCLLAINSALKPRPPRNTMVHELNYHRGWTFHIDSPTGRASRITRHALRPATKSFFQRDSDKLKVQAGDFITVQEFGKDEPTIYLVKELKPDLDDCLVVLMLYRNKDLNEPFSEDADPQELYLEPGDTSVKIIDVEYKVDVFTYDAYKKIPSSSKNKHKDFYCKRCYDGESFSREINIQLIAANISTNPKEQMQKLRLLFSAASSNRAPKRKGAVMAQPEPKREKLKEDVLSDSENENQSNLNTSDSDSDSNEEMPDSQSQKSNGSSSQRERSRIQEHEEVIIIDEEDTDSSESEYERPIRKRPAPKFTTKSPTKRKPTPKKTPTPKPKPKQSQKKNKLEEPPFPSSDSSDSEEEEEGEESDEYSERSGNDQEEDDDSSSSGSESEDDDIEESSSSSDSDDLDSSYDEDNEEESRSYKHKRSAKEVKRPRGRPKSKPDGPKSLIDKNFSMEDEETGIDVTLDRIPELLPGRDLQFKELLNTVEGALKGNSSSVVYVSGPPGIGKTLTTRTLVRYLKNQSELAQVPTFKSVEINGHKFTTRESPYVKLWSILSPGQKVKDSKAAESIDNYLQNPDSKQMPVIIILDEMDEIANKSHSVIHQFFEWANLPGSKVIVIGLANTMDLPERVLKNKTVSRIGLSRMTFSSYSHEQLVEIIKVKLKQTQKNIKNVDFEPRALEYAARKIASVSGDARRTLNVVSRSIQLADEKRLGDEEKVVVKIVHIDRAMKEMSNSAMSRGISDLSFFGKLILAGILSLQRKTGIIENKISSLLSELELIVQLIQAKASKEAQLIENVPLIDVFYQDCIIQPRWFRFIMNELNTSGVISLNDQQIRSSTLFKLLIEPSDILDVFQRDPALKSFTDSMTF